MNEEELEELRQRVARKRRGEEAAKLKNELRGLDKPIDESVVYLSVKEVAEILGVAGYSVTRMIQDGELPRSIKARSGRQGRPAWAIHPDDLKAVEARFRRLVK